MKPGYDSRPRVPAAMPKREAVRLRMLDMTCEMGLVGGWVCGRRRCKYLVVVLHARRHDGIDSEFALLDER